MPNIRHVEHAMGTVFSFDIRHEPTPALTAGLAQATAWLHWVDDVFSPYKPESEISRLARGELTVEQCVPEVAEVLAIGQRYEKLSRGAFSLHSNGALDPCGVVKGWAIERASQLISAAGARNHCVNGGGDLQAVGESAPGQPWRVGIADPFNPGKIAAVAVGRDFAVATSGSAERGHHIIDPHQGTPADTFASVTVVGQNLTHVDCLATSAFALGDQAHGWLTTFELQSCTITATGERWQSANFPGAFV
jgi:thiamine biosynthesis lipoprotein